MCFIKNMDLDHPTLYLIQYVVVLMKMKMFLNSVKIVCTVQLDWRDGKIPPL